MILFIFRSILGYPKLGRFLTGKTLKFLFNLKNSGAIAIMRFSNLCGKIRTSFLQMALYHSSLSLLAVKKFFYVIPTIRKVSFFPQKLSTGSKKGYSMSRKTRQRLYMCDEESSSQATQCVEFYSEGAFQFVWTCAAALKTEV